MTTVDHAAAPPATCGKPPQVTVLELASGYWRTQITYVLARLAVPDALGDDAATPETLAAQVNVPVSMLRRLLRAGTGLGLLSTDEQGRYRLTETGACLRSDLPQSVRGIALMSGEEHYRVWSRLFDAVTTGHPQTQPELGYPDWWSYVDEHPSAGQVFDVAMADLSRNSHLVSIGAFDFGPYTCVVDVGGGTGTVLARILSNNPHLSGVLFDRKHVVAAAGPVLDAAGVAGRCQRVAGDIFDGVPAGADCYLLSNILHDFADDAARQVLRSVRAAIPAHGTLLLVESVLPLTDRPHTAKLNDLNLLLMAGGRERTEEELRTVLRAGGFALESVQPSPTPANVVVARPIDQHR